MKKVLLFVFFTFGAWLTGCAQQTQSQNDDPILYASRLIDAQRADEAILFLESELAKSQNQSLQAELYKTLSSAYAHRAGVKIQKLIPVVQQSERFKKISEQLEQSKNSENSDIKNKALQLNGRISYFLSLIDIYDAIPLVDAKFKDDLEYAIRLMELDASELRSEDYIYRAILNLIKFKSTLQSMHLSFITSSKLNVCQFDPGPLRTDISSLLRIVNQFLSDLGLAFPKQKDSYSKLQTQLSDLQQSFEEVVLSVTGIDDLVKLLTNDSLLTNIIRARPECQLKTSSSSPSL